MKYCVVFTLLYILIDTTSFSQKPYFQQRVDTRIEVSLNDTAHTLTGMEEITYQNNSPDTLSFIYFHLWPNAYKNDRTAYVKQAVENHDTKFYFAKHSDRGYIDSLHFTVDDRDATVAYTSDIDIIKLLLPQPLPPGASVKINTPFFVKIPYTFSRLGHVGKSYQISQWFPKPAVYDNRGWHPIPYLDMGEFYSEYGSYDVSITLPKNYVVMATGNLENADEENWLEDLSKKPLPSDTLYKNSFPESSKEYKTLRYTEDNIHDFAWFADMRWVVRKDTVIVGNNMVTAYTAFFPKDQEGWSSGMKALKHTVRQLSQHVGEYPYKTIKAVEGSLEAGGGMEYPTVTVISPSNDSSQNNIVIIHEAGHNWFYGILGSNERSNPWMDEGINSFYEKEITKSLRQTYSDTIGQSEGNKSSVKVKNGEVLLNALSKLEPLTFMYPMSVRNDMASGWKSDTFTSVSYEGDVYTKMPFLMRWLRGYIGEDSFNAAMKDYFNQWKFKHPYPDDFKNVIQSHTDKDIQWFFDELYSDKPIDFAIKKVSNKNALEVTVKNKGIVAAPVKINMVQRLGGDTSFVWTSPFKGSVTEDWQVTDYYKRVWIDEDIPDFNTRNNSSEKGLKLKPFLGLNIGSKYKTWVLPALGYNFYDGFMLGALFHNISVPQNKFQYIVSPMYAFGSSTFAGTGLIGYTAYFNNSWLHDVQINIEGKTFSYEKTNLNISDFIHARFVKVAPELIFTFKKPYARAPIENKLSLKGYWIGEDVLNFSMDIADSLYRPSKGNMTNNFYGRLRYNHENYRTFNPFSYRLEAQAGKDFAKLSVEASMKIDYFSKGKGLYLRAFGGKFFNWADNEFATSRYWMTTTYTGINDYLYDGTYLGRNEVEGFASQQIAIKEGGFAYRTGLYARPLGLSDDWLFALNVKSDLPLGNIPLRLYANIATFTDAKEYNPSGAKALFETGVELYVTKYLSVYFPVFVSKDYSEYAKSILGKSSYFKTISFTLNIENIDWLNLPKQLMKKM